MNDPRLNDPRQAQIMGNAAKEAMQEKHAFEIRAQRTKVEALQAQVEDRLSGLTSLVQRIQWNADQFPHGAFGRDTETLDALLAALAQESATLANMEAAEEAGGRLSAKFEQMLGEVNVPAQANGQPPEESAIPLGTYL